MSLWFQPFERTPIAYLVFPPPCASCSSSFSFIFIFLQKGAKLAEALRDTIAAFEAEKSSRVDRETQIVNTLADHEALAGQTFDEHRNERMQAIDDIRVRARRPGHRCMPERA